MLSKFYYKKGCFIYRNDLSGACYNEAYDKFNPQLQIFGKEVKFEESLFIQNYQSNTKLTPE